MSDYPTLNLDTNQSKETALLLLFCIWVSMKYFNNKMFYFTEPLEEPCQCIMSCCKHPLQIRRAPGVPVNPLSFSYQCCGCVFCPPQVPRNPESEFPIVAMVNGQLVELDIEAR